MTVTNVTIELHSMVILLHINTVHEGVRYDCNQCDYRYTQQGKHTTHIKLVHNGLRYNCN